MESRNRNLLHGIILEWQQPIYNLAYRMLGNEADAADATQEIFTRVVASIERYDTGRELAPWLFRIARNTIYNMSRDRSVRRDRESLPSQRMAVSRGGGVDHFFSGRGADLSDDSVPGDDLERKELQALVESQLALLPEEERFVLVMHYHGGLSQSELATTLSLPRTTVQSRLGKALEHLRRRLARCGCLEVCPCIEGVLRAAKPLPVPPELTTSLLAISSGVGPVALAGAGLALGGITMNKTLMMAIALLALFCLAGGFVAGKKVGNSGADESSLAASAHRLEADYLRLQSEHRRTLRELEELRQLVTDQARRLERAAATEDGAEVASATEPRPEGETQGAAEPASRFDWTRLSGFLANHLDAIKRSIEQDGDVGKLAPEDQTLLMDMYAEFMKVAKHGRTLSDQPFFDERFIGPLLEALHAEALGLDGAQQAQLRELIDGLTADHLAPLDLTETLPIEAYGVRESVIREFTDTMEEVVTDEQRGRWETLKAVTSRFLEGSRSRIDLPLAKKGSQDAVQGKVAGYWKEAFSLKDGVEARLTPVAATFVEEAERVLARYGQTAEGTRVLTGEERAALESEMLELQIRKERELMAQLTDEERAGVPGSVPTFLLFNYVGNTTTNRRRGMPF